LCEVVEVRLAAGEKIDICDLYDRLPTAFEMPFIKRGYEDS
jgi:hypothetical protein